jgi:hypothetical protein
MRCALLLLPLSLVLVAVRAAEPTQLKQEPNTWLKRSPVKDGQPSPGMGYEASLAYDPVSKRVLRWGGHNQGGGGEQNAETWAYEPATNRWSLIEPNTSPPGVCCAQQNVYDPVHGRFLRFAAFSGNHGWQWFREIYLNNSAVWTFDPSTKRWRDMRTLPAPRTSPLRCATWDDEHQVAVLFGGEGNQEGTLVYDPHTNTWTRKRPTIQPDFRSGGNMAYDSRNKVHVLFGSQFSNDPHTWAYDLRKNEWRDLKPKTQPPTDKNDAVLAYDFNSGKVIAVVRAADKTSGNEVEQGHLETWAFDAAKNEWTKLDPPTMPGGFHNRRRIMVAIPDQNLVLMENYVNQTDRLPDAEREQQVWTYRVAPSKPYSTARSYTLRKEPALIEDGIVSVQSPTDVRVTWTPSPAKDAVGYHVERAIVEVFSEDQVVRLKKDTPPLAEPSVGAIKAIGAFARLTKEPVKESAFTDATVDLTKPRTVNGDPLFAHRFRADQLDEKGKPYRFAVYAYRVRAVNDKGTESGPSPYWLTIPSAPQSVFAKEDGDRCQLKWEANAEAKVQGYRVYRMEGPKVNGPGQPVTRLTAEPVARTVFTDDKATKDTKRYWVVAVDALGQEGFPSAPAWHYRQFRKFYEPFVGEWHQ